MEFRSSDVGRWTYVLVRWLLVKSMELWCSCMLLVVAFRSGEVGRCTCVWWCSCLIELMALRWWRDEVVVDEVAGVELCSCAF